MNISKEEPLVSILLLNWNGLDYTISCITSLLKVTYSNFEIIVVDNGSKNNEASVLKNKFGKKITVIALKKNLGYAGGMNVAYENSKGKYVMFVNNDMEFSSDYLDPLVTILETDKTIGACQPKIISLINKMYFDYSSAAGGYVDIFGYPFARGRIFFEVEKDKGQYDTIVKISWNGIFMVRREVLKKIGLFRSIYFNYGEDMDLSYRIYGAGYSIVNIPSSVVYHVSGGVLKKDLGKKMFFHHRNNIILLLINWPIHYLIFVLPVRIALDFISICYYLVVRFNAGAMGVIKGYISIIIMFDQIIKERQETRKVISDKNISQMPIYKGSIVWQYFILGKKTFAKIIDKENTVINPL